MMCFASHHSLPGIKNAEVVHSLIRSTAFMYLR